MNSIYHMVSVQPGLIPQVIGDITHARFWSATVFVDHYFNFYYTQLMRGTSGEETLQAKEVYKRLKATNGDRVCAYRGDNRRFADPN